MNRIKRLVIPLCSIFVSCSSFADSVEFVKWTLDEEKANVQFVDRFWKERRPYNEPRLHVFGKPRRNEIRVGITGEVNKEGIYWIPANTAMKDLINGSPTHLNKHILNISVKIIRFNCVFFPTPVSGKWMAYRIESSAPVSPDMKIHDHDILDFYEDD